MSKYYIAYIRLDNVELFTKINISSKYKHEQQFFGYNLL